MDCISKEIESGFTLFSKTYFRKKKKGEKTTASVGAVGAGLRAARARGSNCQRLHSDSANGMGMKRVLPFEPRLTTLRCGHCMQLLLCFLLRLCLRFSKLRSNRIPRLAFGWLLHRKFEFVREGENHARDPFFNAASLCEVFLFVQGTCHGFRFRVYELTR